MRLFIYKANTLLVTSCATVYAYFCLLATQTVFVLRILLIGVQNLKNTTITDDEIVISWDAASTSFCRNVFRYYVMISYDNGSLVDEGATEQFNYTFNNLISNTLYVIQVLANNEAGNGSAITIIVKTTGSQGVILNQQLHVYMCQCIIHKLQNNCFCSEIYTRNIIPQ